MQVNPAKSNENTYQLENETHVAVLRRNWGEARQPWLLTGYLNKSEAASSAGRTIDIPDTREEDWPTPPPGHAASNSNMGVEADSVNPLKWLKEDTSGAVNLAQIGALLKAKFGSSAPLVTYSGMGAFRSRFLLGGNLGEIEAASVPAFEAATRAARSSSQVGVSMQAALIDAVVACVTSDARRGRCSAGYGVLHSAPIDIRYYLALRGRLQNSGRPLHYGRHPACDSR